VTECQHGARSLTTVGGQTVVSDLGMTPTSPIEPEPTQTNCRALGTLRGQMRRRVCSDRARRGRRRRVVMLDRYQGAQRGQNHTRRSNVHAAPQRMGHVVSHSEPLSNNDLLAPIDVVVVEFADGVVTAEGFDRLLDLVVGTGSMVRTALPTAQRGRRRSTTSFRSCRRRRRKDRSDSLVLHSIARRSAASASSRRPSRARTSDRAVWKYT